MPFWFQISLRTLVYILVGVMLLIGIVTLFVSVREFYATSLRETIDKKIELLEVLDSTIFHPTVQIRIFGTFPELSRVLVQQMSATEGMRYLKIVDRFTKKIVLSSNEQELEKVVEDTLEFRGKSHIKDKIFEGEPVKEILLKGFSEKVFIAGISLAEIEFETRALFVRQLFILGIGVGASGILVLLVINRFFLSAIFTLRDAFGEVGKENFKFRLSEDFKNEIGDVFHSFNKMTARLAEIRAREETISRLKSEFISIAAHQLRTPLSAIKWTIDTLLEEEGGALNAQQKKLLTKSYATNERMIGLVSDLLDVTRIEEGRFGYDLNYHSLEDVIEESVKKASVAAEHRGIKISFKTQTGRLPQLVFDRDKIALALDNLIENAVNYTLSGGSAEVRLALRGKFAEVSIKDNGVGIPKNQMEYLFTKFFRGDNVVKMQTEGSGLGLFITKNIIKGHGGDIWAESELGKGSTFYFTLPLEKEMIPRGWVGS